MLVLLEARSQEAEFSATTLRRWHHRVRPVSLGEESAVARTKALPHADIGAISTLDDPVRARLYAAVRGAGVPLTREDAAAQAGISRKLAAFHLEKLVDAGLLESRADDRVPRRVGRTPKAYVPVQQ